MKYANLHHLGFEPPISKPRTTTPHSYSLHPTMQGPLENPKNPDMQGLFWFFLESDTSGIGVAVIHRVHTSGVKAHAESNQIRNKC